MKKWEIDDDGMIIDENGDYVIEGDIDGSGLIFDGSVHGAREQIVREHNAHEELVNILESILSHDTFKLREHERKSIESALQKAKGNE